MRGRVAILGGSVAGLAAAIGLARADFAVTVIERDPGPETKSGDEAFTQWERRSVAQFRQPHAFSSRSRNLLIERIPEVMERFYADGVEELNIFKTLAPREIWESDDDRFTGVLARRPAFELALRLVAEDEPAVDILCPAVAADLRCTRTDDGELQVMGIRLADGTRVDADVVLDCGGRRSPIPRWLAEHDVALPEIVQDCESTYFTRYYRRTAECALPGLGIFALRGETAGVRYMGFPGDHGTFAFLLWASSQDDAMRILRHNWAWEATVRAIEPLAPWIDATNSTPVADVAVMAGHENRRREFMDGERPLALNVLPVGDALCTTNPAYGWGASMALTFAFNAVDAVVAHAGDPVAVARAYDEATRAEADGVYRESASMDRMRIYGQRGIPVPDEDALEFERQDLLVRGVAAGAFRDPVLARAMLRRTNLVDRPGTILDDPEVEKRARKVREAMSATPSAPSGPDRPALLALLAAAAPAVAHNGS